MTITVGTTTHSTCAKATLANVLEIFLMPSRTTPIKGSRALRILNADLSLGLEVSTLRPMLIHLRPKHSLATRPALVFRFRSSFSFDNRGIGRYIGKGTCVSDARMTILHQPLLKAGRRISGRITIITFISFMMNRIMSYSLDLLRLEFLIRLLSSSTATSFRSRRRRCLFFIITTRFIRLWLRMRSIISFLAGFGRGTMGDNLFFSRFSTRKI
jgi:hypothetical protein